MEALSIKAKGGKPVQIGNFEITEIWATPVYFDSKPSKTVLGGECKQSLTTFKHFHFLDTERKLGYVGEQYDGKYVWDVVHEDEFFGILRYNESKEQYLYWQFKEPLLLPIPTPTTASDCRKVSFASLKSAKKTIKDMPNRDMRPTQPVRAYRCPVCDLYHLTSQPAAQDDF